MGSSWHWLWQLLIAVSHATVRAHYLRVCVCVCVGSNKCVIALNDIALEVALGHTVY